MARILIATLNYAPEPTGFAPRVTLLAEYLSARGHTVDVFTGFPFTPQWHRHDADRGRMTATERKGSLTVHRMTHFIPRRPSSALQRIAMEGSFAAVGFVTMLWTMMRGRRPDIVVYVGAQPAIAMLARVFAGVARCPYIVNVTDLAAQLALDVGIVGGRLYRLLETLEFTAYAGAAGANVLCRSFADALSQHGFPPDRIRLSRDPIDVDLIRPTPRDERFRAAYGIPADAFVILHAGSMGIKQGLMNVVAAAEHTRDTRICWVFVGDGEARPQLVEAVRTAGLSNTVRFVPFQPDTAMSAMFAAADALLLNQLRSVKDTVIPSKLLTYMAAGRPVIAAVNAGSQAAEILKEADGGLLAPPEDPAALAAAALQLMATPSDARAACAARNRRYAETHFDQRTVLAGHEAFILAAIGSRPATERAA
jgi:colanic acid biosynthesis glycosyl transferase WcaI